MDDSYYVRAFALDGKAGKVALELYAVFEHPGYLANRAASPEGKILTLFFFQFIAPFLHVFDDGAAHILELSGNDGFKLGKADHRINGRYAGEYKGDELE